MLPREVELIWVPLSSGAEDFLGLLPTGKGGFAVTPLATAAILPSAEHFVQGKAGTVVRETVTSWFQKRKVSSQKAQTERQKDR